jgi:hypothetical protein
MRTHNSTVCANTTCVCDSTRSSRNFPHGWSRRPKKLSCADFLTVAGLQNRREDPQAPSDAHRDGGLSVPGGAGELRFCAAPYYVKLSNHQRVKVLLLQALVLS